MTIDQTQTYNTRATAVRGAKRKGYEEHQIVVAEDKDGRWAYTPKLDMPAGKYKVPKPQPGGAVSMIWTFLASHPDMSRKDKIAALIAKNFKPNTVRTQTSRLYATEAARQAQNESVDRD